MPDIYGTLKSMARNFLLSQFTRTKAYAPPEASEASEDLA